VRINKIYSKRGFKKMAKTILFKGIKLTMNSKDHTFECIDEATSMKLTIVFKRLCNVDDFIEYGFDSAFNELFAAHRIFATEDIFKSKGGQIQIAINSHTFASEGYDETSIVLDEENEEVILISAILSTKNGFTLKSLYQFHDDIREFVFMELYK
jgi:hypothetical protein